MSSVKNKWPQRNLQRNFDKFKFIQGSDHSEFLDDFCQQLRLVAKFIGVLHALLRQCIHPFKQPVTQPDSIQPMIAYGRFYIAKKNQRTISVTSLLGPMSITWATPLTWLCQSSERSSFASSFITTSMSVTDLGAREKHIWNVTKICDSQRR